MPVTVPATVSRTVTPTYASWDSCPIDDGSVDEIAVLPSRNAVRPVRKAMMDGTSPTKPTLPLKSRTCRAVRAPIVVGIVPVNELTLRLSVLPILTRTAWRRHSHRMRIRTDSDSNSAVHSGAKDHNSTSQPIHPRLA